MLYLHLHDVMLIFLFFKQVTRCVSSPPTPIFPRVPPRLSLSLVDYPNAATDRTPEHVRKMLNHNLHTVLTGKRAREFAIAYSKNSDSFSGIYASVVSTHGRTTGTKKKLKDEVKQHVIEVLSEVEKENQLPPPSLFTLCARATKLSWNFAPCIATCGLAYISSSFRANFWYRLLANCISDSGPAFIKWGQWASTRSDMFEKELCISLSSLHSNAPAHSWEFTQSTVEEALKIPSGTLFEVFDLFDKKPLASGSIAQIHKAVLKPELPKTIGHLRSPSPPTGTTIAVKVRHPMVAELIDWDFRIMLWLADVVDAISALKWLNVRSSVEQFSCTMAAQAHLDVEAHHLEILNYNFRKWKAVGFPRPYYATNTIICETFEYGEITTTIIEQYYNEAKQVGGLGYELIPLDLAKFLVTNGLSVYMKMLLVDNLMHADLHPGNIMLCMNHHRDNSRIVAVTKPSRGSNSSLETTAHSRPSSAKEQFNMILVDAGMVAHLDTEECDNFIGFLASLGQGDGRRAAENILQFSSPSDDYSLSEEAKEKFACDMVALFSKFCRGYGTNVDVGVVLREVLQLIRIHRVRIAANYATLVINVLCIESLAHRVSPQYNLLDAAKPLLASYYKICGSKHASVGNSKIRHSIMRWWMPMMYIRKAVADNIFFLKQHRERLGANICWKAHATNFSLGINVALVTAVVAYGVIANGGQLDFSVLSSLFQKRVADTVSRKDNFMSQPRG